jgi:hypothetical protein
VLDPKVIALMSAPHASIPGESQRSYCYGLETAELRGVRIIEHSGSRAGYGSQIRMFPAQRAAIIVQTNRSGATLPSTVGVASGLLVPLGPPSPPTDNETPRITADDAARVAGVYENGSQRIEIVVRDNRLVLKRARGAEVELAKRSQNSFTAGTSRLTMVAGTDGKTEYVHTGARSFVRVP